MRAMFRRDVFCYAYLHHFVYSCELPVDRLPVYTYGTLNGLDGRDLQFLWGFREQSRTSTDRYGGTKLLFFSWYFEST